MVSPPALRILYLGTPEFAVPSLRRLLDSSHRIVGVVSQPDRPRGRGHHVAPTPTKALAAARGIPVLQPDRIRTESFLQQVATLAPDLGVVAAYGKILPDALLQLPRLGMINVHASLLPRWRGAAPVHRAVIAGDTMTGVTIMQVVSALDAGPMYSSSTRPIGPDETSPQVEADLAALGADLLVEVVDRLAAGGAAAESQDEAGVTYAPKIAKHEGAIDWGQPALQIHNLVRGLQPWPLVSARLAGARLLIHQTRPTDRQTAAGAGTVVRADGDAFEVAAGDGRVLRIVALQPEGRRVMTARAFLAGHPVGPGARLERG